MAAGDATWNPKKNAAYRVTFPILDADGDLVTGATDLDSEVSKDAGTFADCTNEATEIATSSGVYYLDLTATEMNADTVAVIVKTSSSGAKTTVLVMYPLETADMPVDVLSWNSVAATGMPMPTYTQPSGFLAATFPAGTIASTTNITAGTIATVTNAVTANTTQLAGQTVTAAGAVTFPSTVSSLTAGGVRTELSTELGRIDVATSTRLAGSAYTTPPTAATIADAIWDETIGDHLAAGSTGAALNAAGSAGDPWTTTLPGSYTGSQAGKILADILTDTGTTLQAEVDDIQSRLPAALVSGRMDASVGAMAANTLTASALATDAASEVATAVRSELTTELGRIDAAVSTRVATSALPTHFSSLEIASNGHVSAAVQSIANNSITASSIQGAAITAAKFATGAIDANALATDAVTEIAGGVLTTAMTESYRTAGNAPTLAQAAFELLAHMGDSSISGSTKTLRKIDGTTAKTFTLDSSTAPTSISEAT